MDLPGLPLLGVCWPYLDQRPAPPETWAALRALEPAVVRICSNAAPADVAALHLARLRWARICLRLKWPKLDPAGRPYVTGDPRPDLLDYREWAGEPTPREAIQRWLDLGHQLDLEPLNEPDIEWDESSSWGPAERWLAAAADCRVWLERQVEAIVDAFGTAVRLLLPALSQGWPERHDIWLAELEPLATAPTPTIAIHAYTAGRAWDEPDWGGRPIEYAARFPSAPLCLTETNDNGYGWSCPGRGARLARYLAWLGATCPNLEYACIFALPGQPETPPWWSWSPEQLAQIASPDTQHSDAPILPLPPQMDPTPDPPRAGHLAPDTRYLTPNTRLRRAVA